MNNYDAKDIGEFVNIGTGKDLTIKELAEKIKEIVGFKGEIDWDSSKPDGTPRKLINVDKLNELCWEAKKSFKGGLIDTYRCYKNKLLSKQ